MRKIADKKNPEQRQEKLLARHIAGISRGGEKERSHRKLVGNIARRNIDTRYDVIKKAHNRIEKLYTRHLHNDRKVM